MRNNLQITFLEFGGVDLFCTYRVFPENEYSVSYPVRPKESVHLSYDCFKMFSCYML